MPVFYGGSGKIRLAGTGKGKEPPPLILGRDSLPQLIVGYRKQSKCIFGVTPDRRQRLTVGTTCEGKRAVSLLTTDARSDKKILPGSVGAVGELVGKEVGR